MGKVVKNGIGRSFIFNAIIPAFYTFGENFVTAVKLKKNVLTSACLNLNYSTTEQSPKNVKRAKMLGFINTFGKFNFARFFDSAAKL